MKTSILLLASFLPVVAIANPVQMTHQGRVTNADGVPINGVFTVSVSFWDYPSETDVLTHRTFNQDLTDVAVDDGFYTVVLGTDGGLQHTVFNEPLWTQVVVNGTTMQPRTRVTSVPMAAADGWEPWTDVTFQSGWGNLGGPYQTVQYRRRGDMVCIRGAANRGSGVGDNTVIFNLPAGYRVPADLVLLQGGNGGTSSDRVDIHSDGRVRMDRSDPTNWTAFNNTCFSTTP